MKSERNSNTTKIETQYEFENIKAGGCLKEILIQQRLKPEPSVFTEIVDLSLKEILIQQRLKL